MNRILKLIGTILCMMTMLLCGYYFGSTQQPVKVNNYINVNDYEFINNYVDMRTVTDFTATENGLMLYLNNGYGYYWER